MRTIIPLSQQYLRTLLKISYSISILFMFSCSKFLEEKVDDRTLITTLEEMELTLKSLNPPAGVAFTEFMTDNYAHKEVPSHYVLLVRNHIANVYRFRCMKENLANSDYNLPNFNPNRSWVRYYFRIQNASLVISKANKYNARSAEEELLKEQILGKALAIRAYCHFMLVNLFAKSYDSATASSDKGIPLVRTYTGLAIEKYPIASVEETYDFIEKDLLEALPIIKTWDEETNPKFNFTAISVEALLAQLYLFKKDWEKSVKYADRVIAKNSNILPVSTIMNQNRTRLRELSKQFYNPEHQSYLLMSENTTQFLSYYWSGFYTFPLRGFMGSFDTNIVNPSRVRFYFINTSPLIDDIVFVNTMYFLNSPAGRHTISLPLLSVDRVFYNRAEAYIQLGKIEEAKTDLRSLLSRDFFPSANWMNRLNTLTDPNELTTYLLNSKRIRFHSEGVRWFDMRRHRISVTHEMNGDRFTIDGTKPEDYVIKYPQEEIDAQ